MSKYLALLLSVLFLVSCAANKKLTTLETTADEAIVAGKIKVLYNGLDVTDKAVVLFNEKTGGTYAYKPDSTGVLITKLPLG